MKISKLNQHILNSLYGTRYRTDYGFYHYSYVIQIKDFEFECIKSESNYVFCVDSFDLVNRLLGLSNK